jgi:hypothetical protein
MFSNKFDVGFVYVFKFGFDKIIFNFLLIKSNLFLFINFDPNFLASFFIVDIFFLNLYYFCHISPNKIAKLGKFETKKMCRLGRVGVNPTI